MQIEEYRDTRVPLVKELAVTTQHESIRRYLKYLDARQYESQYLPTITNPDTITFFFPDEALSYG